MNNQETKNLLQEVKKLNNLTGFAFTMAIADAVERIEKEQSVIEKMRKPSAEYLEYQEKGLQINKQFSVLDENGEPKTENKRFNDGQLMTFLVLDPEKSDERLKAQANLDKLNAKLIAEQKLKDENAVKALSEESTIKINTLSEKALPKDITVEQMMIIRKLIKVLATNK